MCPSPNKTNVNKPRILRQAGHLSRVEKDKSDFKIVIGKPTGKIPLGRPRYTWEDNIRMDFKKIGINARN